MCLVYQRDKIGIVFGPGLMCPKFLQKLKIFSPTRRILEQFLAMPSSELADRVCRDWMIARGLFYDA